MKKSLLLSLIILISTNTQAEDKLVICQFNEDKYDWICIDGDKNKLYNYCIDVNEALRVCSSNPIEVATV